MIVELRNNAKEISESKDAFQMVTLYCDKQIMQWKTVSNISGWLMRLYYGPLIFP